VADWIEYVLASVLLLVWVTFGVGLAEANAAATTLARIAASAANQMSVEGGWTAPVQQAVIQALQQNGFNPAAAQVTVSPAGQRAPYGQAMAVTVAYPVPVRIVDVSPITVPIRSTATTVSLFVPTSPAAADPVLNPPGAGTPDLAGAVAGVAGTWQGP
jgi:hypothetical protein